VFFDLKNARPVAGLLDATLKYPDELVQVIRLGRHPQNTTRVVMDMNGVDTYSVFTLYNPYRLVIDFHKTGAPVVVVFAGSSTHSPDKSGRATVCCTVRSAKISRVSVGMKRSYRWSSRAVRRANYL